MIYIILRISYKRI